MSTTEHFTVDENIEHFTIADIAEQNPDFRRVLWTGAHAQIVTMTIPTGEEGPVTRAGRIRGSGVRSGGPRGRAR